MIVRSRPIRSVKPKNMLLPIKQVCYSKDWTRVSIQSRLGAFGLKKIVVTGASGQVGSLIVPQLIDRGCDLVLVGRNPTAIILKYPGVTACSYDDLASHMIGANLLLHLAVLNNNVTADAASFQEVNVNLTLFLAQKCAEYGVQRFVNVSSTQALDEMDKSHYAQTKRAAQGKLLSIAGLEIETIFLPLVYGDHFVGRLKFLNKLPILISKILFKCFSALKPTVHASKIVEHILADNRHLEDLVIISDRQSENIIFCTIKRTIDLAFVLLIGLGFWWLLFLIWLVVRVDSKGPGLFVQDRIGKSGVVFKCYKFRTMMLGVKDAATHETPSSAVTRFGKILRQSKLDELPQIWNILRNEMNLVGPRPCLPTQTELIRQRLARGIFTIAPGITGLAQVQGIDMSDPIRLAKVDQLYLETQGLLSELKIIYATLLGKGAGDNTRK